MSSKSNQKVNLSEFLRWAEDKILVVWSEGALCQSESLRKFCPSSAQTVEEFLNHVVYLVHDEDAFHFYNEAEEYEKYYEVLMNPKELIECYVACTQ